MELSESERAGAFLKVSATAGIDPVPVDAWSTVMMALERDTAFDFVFDVNIKQRATSGNEREGI